MELRAADRLILLMLSEIHQKLGIDGELNAEFVKHVLYSGHSWAFNWEYPGLFPGSDDDDPPEVSEVVDAMDMWSFIEDSMDMLSPADQQKVRESGKGYSRQTEFPGFDGNNETEHLSIARTLVDHLGRFSRYKGSDMNSHRPTLPEYGRMLSVFAPMRKNLGGRISGGGLLTADELVSILDA